MKKRKACLHMEVFDNLGVPLPDERNNINHVKNEVILELIKIIKELLEK